MLSASVYVPSSSCLHSIKRRYILSKYLKPVTKGYMRDVAGPNNFESMYFLYVVSARV